MRDCDESQGNGADSLLAGTCPYLGSIAPDLRILVMSNCPGCNGTGPCLVRQAIRTVAAADNPDTAEAEITPLAMVCARD